ncbi:MAG: ribosome maturation factor RimM [Mariprofundaceae bacterium]
MIHVGDILGVHGLKGALTIYSHTRPANGIAGYCRWWLGKSVETAKAYSVNRCWQHGTRILADLDGVSDRNASESLKGLQIWVQSDEIEVDDGEFLWTDLIDCAVYDASESLLGYVTELHEYGAQDILVIKTAPDAKEVGEWMLPFIESVIIDVNLDELRIDVKLPEGMDVCFAPKF